MKKRMFILFVFLFIFGIVEVNAASFDISGPNSSNINTNYAITIKYNGNTKIGAAVGKVNFTNSTCSATGSSGVILNCSSSSCSFNLNYANGYSNGATLINMTCKSSSSGTASFSTSATEAWNDSGEDEITISNKIKSVSIVVPQAPTTNAPTTKNNATTQKTTTQKTTTKKTNANENNTTTTTALTTSSVEETTTTTTKKIIEDNKKSLELKKIKIVGYDYKIENGTFVINVPEDINEIYVEVETVDSDVNVVGDGIHDISNENELKIIVSNEDKKEEYIVKINKVKDNKILLIIISSIVSSIVVGIIVYLATKKKNKNIE